MAWTGYLAIATPYAGITRVRFKGYNLSRSPFRTFQLNPEVPAPLTGNLL